MCLSSYVSIVLMDYNEISSLWSPTTWFLEDHVSVRTLVFIDITPLVVLSSSLRFTPHMLAELCPELCTQDGIRQSLMSGLLLTQDKDPVH